MARVNVSGNVGTRQSISGTVSAGTTVTASVGTGGYQPPGDYLKLKNKPTINGVPLTGNMSTDQLGFNQIVLFSDIDPKETSKAGWIYMDTSDKEHITIRTGDGSAYIQDLPAIELGKINDVEELLREHIAQKAYHTKSYIDSKDPENLVLITL